MKLHSAIIKQENITKYAVRPVISESLMLKNSESVQDLTQTCKNGLYRNPASFLKKTVVLKLLHWILMSIFILNCIKRYSEVGAENNGGVIIDFIEYHIW